MTELDLMHRIAEYNEIDCRSMADVLAWHRTNR